jgi:hypothetical protein
MNRRMVLTLLAFLAAGVLVAQFAISYLHSSPAPIATTSSGETSNGGPVVNLNLTTVAAVGFGEHPNWVGYLPTTFFKVPPNATLRITISQQDGASGARNAYLGLVRGTVGDSMTVNGKTMQAIDPTMMAHSFTVPDLGVSVPLLGVADNAPAGASNTIVFSFKVPAKGVFHWQCFVPCAAGTLYGNGGPMQTLGFMDGQIEVGT